MYVLADALYGVSPTFIAAVEALPDKTHFVSVPKDTQCWLKRPMTITKEYRWGGKTLTKTVLFDWHLKIRMGEKSTIHYSVAA